MTFSSTGLEVGAAAGSKAFKTGPNTQCPVLVQGFWDFEGLRLRVVRGSG